MSTTTWRFEVRAETLDLAERLIAEVWAAGSSGVEEEGTTLRVYASADDVEAVRAAALCLTDAVGRAEAVEAVDWSQEWKRGLTAWVVSERLVVRPSFVTHDASPGQRELIVEPGQAFGTGGHASTRLALEWIDALYGGDAGGVAAPVQAEVLDVGTGSAVLAMAAVRLGAQRALGVDIDAVAIEEARGTVAANALADRVELRVGSLESIAEPRARFDLLVANMLSSEMTPLFADMAARLRAGGLAIFSGLLEREEAAIVAALDAVGISVLARRTQPDVSRAPGDPGNDWLGLLARRR